jgi:hypothetical protein
MEFLFFSGIGTGSSRFGSMLTVSGGSGGLLIQRQTETHNGFSKKNGDIARCL